jgi:hypothetical protein
VVLYVHLPGDDEVQSETPRITINGVALTASEAQMMCLAVMSFAEIIDHLDLKDDSSFPMADDYYRDAAHIRDLIC